MKKSILILTLSLIIFITGCSVDETNNESEEVLESVDYEGYELEENHIYKKITPEELRQMILDTEDIYIFFGRSSWQYCVVAAPILNEKAKEYNIDIIYYANVEEYMFDEYFTKYNFEGVPNVIYLEAGEFKNASQLYDVSEYETLDEYFEKVFKQFFTKND